MTTQQQQHSITTTPNPAISVIDPKPIVKNGESPTAIILAVTILFATVFSSLTGLIQVILQNQTQQSR